MRRRRSSRPSSACSPTPRHRARATSAGAPARRSSDARSPRRSDRALASILDCGVTAPAASPVARLPRRRAMPLLIGVPREVYPGEKRVATVPDVVEKLIKQGFRVAVEAGAGEGAQIDDDAYRAA